MTDTPWWRDSVIYQLYVRSFADSDGDGIGDLDGITAHLDHIAALGVDGLWLNPCYPSPNHDGGYDVADYTTIAAELGGLPAFERLLEAAHARGLKLLMDLVPNHCSAEHAWFQAALAAQPGSPERDRFIFRDGRGSDGAEPPNNWRSTFGGPAWTRTSATGQWYLHSFDSSQPDFNWGNDDVAEMFDDVLRLWFDRGIDGFRIDVAYAMVKHPDLPDVDDPAGDNPYAWNQPGVHDIFKRWRAIADGYRRDLTLIGEVWLPPADTGPYIRPAELTQVFYFDLLQQVWDAPGFRDSIQATLTSLTGAEGVPTWVLNSHDVHRAVSRYGLVRAEPPNSTDLNAPRTRPRGTVDVALGADRAKAALLLLLALPGSVYLYQGEELGLPEVQDIPDHARRDPIWTRTQHTEHGRDGCRVPIPWTETGPSFGFSPADASAPPWLPQPDWFGEYAVASQDGDADSTLALYQRVLLARRKFDSEAPLEWHATGHPGALAFRRGELVCVTVFDGPNFTPPPAWGTPVLTSKPIGLAIPAGTTAWLMP